MTRLTCEMFQPAHLAALTLQRAQIGELEFVERPEFLAGPLSFTGMLEGRPIACAGIVEATLGIGAMWAFLGEDAGPHMLRLTRAGHRMLALAGLRRVEANTPCDFLEGCRWLKVLGFQLEGTMHKYGPDGSDHFRYARVS